MPKVKKIRSAALAGKQARHAPLGQIIQEDENRGKYAPAVRNRRPKKDDKEEKDDDLMDERASKRILEMSREQQLEMEREDAQRQQRERNHAKRVESDEEEDEDSVPLEEGDDE